MYYSIDGLTPAMERDGSISMSGWGFNIKLMPEFKEMVAGSDIDQEKANTAVENMGRYWLDGCGYTRIFDPDNCGFDADSKKPPGPDAYPAYRPGVHLTVSWGEWGPEHISVPGNACGLDIERRSIGGPKDGAALWPHNVDTMIQAMLLLTVFCWFAEAMRMTKEVNEINERRAYERPNT